MKARLKAGKRPYLPLWPVAALLLALLVAVVGCPARKEVKEVKTPPPRQPAAEQPVAPAAVPEEPPVTGEPAEVGYNGAMAELKITSSAFADGEAIPPKYTADGEDVNPPLTIAGIPEGAQSLALIMDDPDAPMGTWDHWIVFNIAPDTAEIAENSVPGGAVQGRNGWGRSDYGGPAPPRGTHRYCFKLYALDTMLELPAGTNKARLEAAMRGHILAEAELVGLYSR